MTNLVTLSEKLKKNLQSPSNLSFPHEISKQGVTNNQSTLKERRFTPFLLKHTTERSLRFAADSSWSTTEANGRGTNNTEHTAAHGSHQGNQQRRLTASLTPLLV